MAFTIRRAGNTRRGNILNTISSLPLMFTLASEVEVSVGEGSCFAIAFPEPRS